MFSEWLKENERYRNNKDITIFSLRARAVIEYEVHLYLYICMCILIFRRREKACI